MKRLDSDYFEVEGYLNQTETINTNLGYFPSKEDKFLAQDSIINVLEHAFADLPKNELIKNELSKVYIQQAMIYLCQQDYDTAQHLLEKSENLAPKEETLNNKTVFWMAVTHLYQNDISEAQNELKTLAGKPVKEGKTNEAYFLAELDTLKELGVPYPQSQKAKKWIADLKNK